MAIAKYIRVSSVQQSLARQEEMLKDVEGKLFSDKSSGKKLERKGLVEAIEWLREDDELYVASIDRLSRSTADLFAVVKKLHDKGVTINFVKENLRLVPEAKASAMEKMVFTMFAAFAQFEREIMLERQREGYAAKIAAGEVPHRGRAKTTDEAGIIEELNNGGSINKTAAKFNVSRTTIVRIKQSLKAA